MENNSKQAEQKRVDLVQEEIIKQLALTKDSLNKATSERRKVESTYGDTAKVNLAEVDDRMETNAAIQQQKQLVALAFENETILTNREKHLNLLNGTPYFGRIDISEDGEQESLYIGTSSLIDENDEFLVYDWRAPISSLYYNGTLGPAEYETPVGIAEANLDNKRQFKIENGQITKMFDTNETVGDDILQDILSENSDTHMKNIVASVQEQQNEIIRNTNADLLVVQGVAGSGKTSAILQRIAYLLYHSRTQLNSDQIILFSPNNLFSNYIAEVLPSLGEKNMRQVTLNDFLVRRHQGFVVETLFDRFEKDQQSFPEETHKIRDYFASSQFMNDVKLYLKQTPSDDLPFVDLLIEGKIIIAKKEAQAIYSGISNQHTLAERFYQTKVALTKILKQRVKKIAATPEIEQEIENLSDSQYLNLLGEQTRKKNYDDEFQFLAEKLAHRKLRPVHNAIQNDLFIDLYQTYLNFLKQLRPVDLNHDAFKEVFYATAQNIELHHLDINDAIGIMYLRDLLTGSGQNFNIKYLFVDEMQDYSPAILTYLAHSFPKAKFTLLGDYAQDIFSMTEMSSDVAFNNSLSNIFPNKKISAHLLNTSYRSTKEITDFGKALINNPTINSFNRGAKLPEVIELPEEKDFVPSYLDILTEQLAKYKMVAVITKNIAQAQTLAEQLTGKIEFNLITQKTRSLKNGLIILPIYLAKGLEFDSVIAHNVSAKNYNITNSSEIIYTVSSRAMHNLILTSLGSLAPDIKNVSHKLYHNRLS